MTKSELYACYTSYLDRHPEKRLLENVDFDSIKYVSKYYLNIKDVPFWDSLPDELSTSQIADLNTQCQGKLRWELIESNLTANDLDDFERMKGIKISEEFRNFLMGYTPLLGTVIADFVGSEDYYCYTFNSKTKSFDYLYDDDDLDAPKIARVQFSFTPILYKHELSYLNDRYPLLLPYGLLCLGELCCVGQEIIFLDCSDGNIVSIYHDELISDDISDEQLNNLKHFRFKNFDHFLRCMLGAELYDAKKEDEKRVEEYKQRPHNSSSSPNVIAL